MPIFKFSQEHDPNRGIFSTRQQQMYLCLAMYRSLLSVLSILKIASLKRLVIRWRISASSITHISLHENNKDNKVDFI